MLAFCNIMNLKNLLLLSKVYNQVILFYTLYNNILVLIAQ